MWRSLLFVPVLEGRFIEKAATRGADALVLDLEASVAADRKQEARNALPSVVERLAGKTNVTVRINPLWLECIRDLEVSVRPGVQALHIAYCENAEHVRFIDGIVSELEAERNIEVGTVKLIAMIESPDSLIQAAKIAKASPRLYGLTLGVEDYATSMGATTSQELLRPAVLQVIQAAKAAKIHPFAVPASMADFSDLSTQDAAARYARSLGSVGGYAVHPSQIETLNQVFSVSDAELAWAKKVVTATKESKNLMKGAFNLDGQMIDKPLIERALLILDRS